MRYPTTLRATAPLLLPLLFLLAGAPARAQTVHALDDGTAEDTVGWYQTGGSVFFANQFTAAPGGSRVDALSIAYGRPPTPAFTVPGTPVHLLLFRDALGRDTPTRPVLLASAPGQVTRPGTNTFVRVPIDPTDVEGHFFVGVLASDLPAGGQFPVGFDRHNPAGRSFGAFYSTAKTLDDLAATTFDPTLVTSSGLVVGDRNAFLRAIDGQFLLRAESVPVPEPTAAGGVVLAAAFTLRRRRSR